MTKEALRAQVKNFPKPALFSRLKYGVFGKELLEMGTTFAFFSPMQDEPDTEFLVREAAKVGSLFYPRVEGDCLVFVSVEGKGQFKQGVFGVFEPLGKAFNGKIDVMFIPGLAFDKYGGRLGRGKGYYDRYLASYTGIKVGVTFEEHLVDKVPMESHDVFMDFILTENELIHIA